MEYRRLCPPILDRYGGVLLTLWLTAKIADSAKQREVRQAMQLVALELRDNLQVIQDYKWMYNDEKRSHTA